MSAPRDTPDKTLIDLETKFWQSMVDLDTEAAVELISEPALMVTPMGVLKFDRAAYREMAKREKSILTSFELSAVQVVFPNDSTAIVTYHVKQSLTPRGKGESTLQEMNDSSTWIKKGSNWECVLHTETPAEGKRISH
jgi:hypothetical protein